MIEEDLLLDPVGDDYPSLVGEALLSLDSDEFSCSASLSENGYVWMVVGRRLFVWKLENEKASANAAYQLSLPPSGLPYNVRTVRVYLRPNSSNVGVIAISPEGTIRHWPNIGRSYSDSSVDLEREVALSLDEVIDSEASQFILSTTTCSFFLLTIEGGGVPTPGKRQRMTSDIHAKPLYTNAKRGIGRRMSSLLFGDTNKHGSRLLRATVIKLDGREWHSDQDSLLSEDYEGDGNGAGDGNEASGDYLDQVCIFALKQKNVQLYSVEQCAKLWTFDPTRLASEHFANHVWNLRDAPESSKWRQEIRIWLVDCVRCRDGIVILLGASNNAVSTQIHFALAYLRIGRVDEVHESFEWFCALKLPSNETFRSTDEDALMDLSLQIPASSEHCAHTRIEGLLLITHRYAHSIRLPDTLEGNTDVGTVHSVPFIDNDIFIGAACDSRFCYVMLKERGINRLRLLPRGFETVLAKNVASVQTTTSTTPSVYNADYAASLDNDRDLLAEAFLLFVKTDLTASYENVQNLLGIRRTSVAQLCINYALDIVDSVPNDERWNSIAARTRRKSALTKSSFLLSVHLDEQKKKVLAMFILFLKNMGLDVKWDTTVQSRLSNSRSARSQLAELTEKVDIAIALYNWCQTQTVPYFDAAVNRVLTQRDESMTFDLLTPYDHFFHRLSRIDELLESLLLEEETCLSDSSELNEKVLCIEEIGSALVVFVDAIEQHRDDEALIETEDHLKWTQQNSVLSPIIKHLDIICDYYGSAMPSSLSEDGTNALNKIRLHQHALTLSAFVLGEQSQEERLASPIITKFIEIGDRKSAIDLATRFHDYRTLIELTENLTEERKRAQIEQYKNQFDTSAFHRVLHEYYMEKGQLKNLLQEEGPQAEQFFSSHDTVKWIREIVSGEYEKASHSLRSLAQKQTDDVMARKEFLSFAKLCALCADNRDDELLDEIKSGLRLIKHQENIPLHVLEKANALSNASGKQRPLSAEQIISANVSDPQCDCDSHFRALLTLSSLLDDPTSRSHCDLIKSLKAKIWLSAIKANSALWRQMRSGVGNGGVADHKQTVYCELLQRLVECDDVLDCRKLELLPNTEELIGCMTELGKNQRFTFIVRSEEELARREVGELANRKKAEALRAREFAVAHGFAY